MGRLFPAGVAGVGRESMVEGLAENILRVFGKPPLQILRELIVAGVGHGEKTLGERPVGVGARFACVFT